MWCPAGIYSGGAQLWLSITLEPGNIRFYSLNEIRTLARLSDDAHQSAAHDRRICKPADLPDVLRRRDPEAERDRQRCGCAHPRGERFGTIGNFVARPGHAEPRDAVEK